MPLAPAGLPINLPAVFPGANPAFVAMSVYDDTGTSPVLLLSPVLMAPVHADCYRGKFTPLVGKLYVAYMAVYTDGTFTTLDAAFAVYQQAFSVQGQYLTPSAGQLVGQVAGDAGCGGPFSIFLANAKTMFLRAMNAPCNGGDPLDLTYCSEIDVQLPNQDGTFTHLKLSLGQVLVTQPPVLGKFQVPITALVSAALNQGELQNFDVTFTILGEVFTVRYYQALSVYEVR